MHEIKIRIFEKEDNIDNYLDGDIDIQGWNYLTKEVQETILRLLEHRKN